MFLLRVGKVSMLIALALAAVVAVVVNFSGAEERTAPVASAEPQAAEAPVKDREPDNVSKKKVEDEPREEPRANPREEPRAKPPLGEPRATLREEPQATLRKEPQETRPPEEPRATPPPPEEPQATPPLEEPRATPPPEERRTAETLPIPSEGWDRPSQEEIASANAPRHYPPRADAELTLTIEALEVYDAPVIDSTSEEALSNGVVHIPETPMPWDESRQKNVYLAGHRVGYDGSGSRMIFYNLDKLSGGDSVVLKDRSGNAYEYRVSEVFVVEPDAGWVLDPVRDRDMLTLQSCTYPTFETRLIVRADRV